jgi:hypothetical protein
MLDHMQEHLSPSEIVVVVSVAICVGQQQSAARRD